MAKLVLTIDADNKKAIEGIEALKKEVAQLSQSLSEIKVNKNLTAQINALTKHFNAIANAHAKVTANANKQAIADEKLKQQQARTATEATKLATAQARLEKATQKSSTTTEQLQRKFANLLSTIKSLKSSYPQGTFDEMEQGVRANMQAAKDGTKSVDDLGTAYDTLSTKVAVAKAETDKVTTAVVKSGDSIGSLAKKFLLWQVTATLVMQPLRLIQNALTSINETLVKTEDAVIALQRVLPTGSATDSEISSRLYKVAQDYGQTFENVSQIATNFARTGMSWADTIKATEAAVLALNVAELDATEASEGLISILTQFEMTADQLTEVVDKLNKAADKNPVTTEKLLTALQRTGAAAKNANITLDETIGIITTLSKATNRSGENLGTAVNSLIQFSSKESSLDTFAKFGGDVEIAVEKFRAGAGSILEIWEELGEVIQDRQGEAESILGGGLFNNEEWASLNDELKEALGESYADVTDIYNTASVFRRNYFVALLNDMDNVKKVTGEIADANGYSQAENEKYLNTYTAKLNSLKAQWQDLANSEQGILGIKKALVDVGSVLLTIMKWTGGLRTTLLAISTIVWLLVGDKILLGLKAIGTVIKALVTGLRNATVAAQGLHAALGAIGAIATVVSVVVGGAINAVNAFNEAQEKANRKAVEHWTSIQEEAQQLEELTEKYKNLTTENSEYADVEEQIVDLLGTKAIQLADLTKGTEEYKEKVIQLTEAQKNYNRAAAQAAANAAGDIFNAQKYGSIGSFRDESVLFGVLQRNGFDVSTKTHSEGDFWRYLADPYGTGGADKGAYTTSEVNLSGNTYKDEASLDRLVQFLLKNGYGQTDVYDTIYSAWKERNDAIAEYLNSFVPSYAFEDITSNEDLDSVIDKVLSATKINEAGLSEEELNDYRDLIESIIERINGYRRQQSEETKKETNNIQDQVDKYDDLIDKLKELRDADKEILDLEERKKDYLEAQNELIKAQQALENARNEATVRRFNEATGQWEWQVDEKKVAEAEEAVKEQQEEVEQSRKDLEDQAYDALIELLNKEDPPTNDELVDLLDGLEEFLGSGFVEKIKSAFIGVANVDLDKPVLSDFDAAQNYINEKGLKESDREKWTEDKTFAGLYNALTDEEKAKLKGATYDSGGAAVGKGLMRKATDKDETVNGPDLTAKILSPVSNDQFHRYVRDMGLLFETSRQYAQAPVVERVGGATDNSVNNSGQIIMNGVSIGAEKRASSLDEILALGGIVPKV